MQKNVSTHQITPKHFFLSDNNIFPQFTAYLLTFLTLNY